MTMKRNVKPIEGEFVSDYWRRCEGSFAGKWYGKAIKYAEKNGGKHYLDGNSPKITLNK